MEITDIFGDKVSFSSESLKLVGSFVFLKEIGTSKSWEDKGVSYKVSWSEKNQIILEMREKSVPGYLLYVFAPQDFMES